MKQQTIERSISLEGIGIHSGCPSTITLKPAPEGFGIRFYRVDLSNSPEVTCSVENVLSTHRSTVIGNDACRISTVEHLVSALYGLQIDNVKVEISGEEVPIADGSSDPFCKLIMRAGIVSQTKERSYQKLGQAVWVQNETSSLLALPYEGFKITVMFVNDHQISSLSDEFFESEITPEIYRQQLAPARTFGYLNEVKQLLNAGLIKGLTESNVIRIDDHRILTPLRFQNELVRHKGLDLIGDLALNGPLHAHIIAVRPSHLMNHKLAVEIQKQIKEISV